MNPDDVNVPWGVLPEGISVGDRIEGESCTDIRGRRTGTLVGAGTRGNSPSVAEIVNDGTVHFVHAGSVKPLPAESDRDPSKWRKVPKPGGGTGWMPVDPPAGSVSVPLPTPTPEREALRNRMAAAIAKVVGFDFDDAEATDQDQARQVADAVMPVVDELRAEIETLRWLHAEAVWQRELANDSEADVVLRRSELAMLLDIATGELATTREELEQWRASFGESALRDAVAAFNRLREELATASTARIAAETALRHATVGEPHSAALIAALRADLEDVHDSTDSENSASASGRASYVAGVERCIQIIECQSRVGSSPVPEEPTAATEWRPMESAPTDGTVIVGDYDGTEVKIRFADSRVCMLASVAPGAGTIGPGWEDVDNGLYADDPERWHPIAPSAPSLPEEVQP